MTGNDGRSTVRPFIWYALSGPWPSREDGPLVAGAVLCLLSSCDQWFDGVPWRGKGNKPACELERVEDGESAEGEKYELPGKSPGESAPAGTLVFRLSGGCIPLSVNPRREGGPRLPFWAAIFRKLLLEGFRLTGNSEVTIPGVNVDSSSSSTSSFWRYGFSGCN